ncbi:MAG: uracil-DNA glycosylase [Alphaproteobacteria bacterium]
MSGIAFAEPARDCPLCPRLAAFREGLRRTSPPDWHNAPVPAFGAGAARLLVVGLAPGLTGATRTGRPFTGDYAGDLLYPTLIAFGLARGRFERRPDDGLELADCRVTNAVRCLPPANKPVGAEIAACRPFLRAEIASMPSLRVVLALGRIAHDSVLAALGQRLAHFRFAHGAFHTLPDGITLADSYHCSRYNTNTGRLTEAMFQDVVGRAAALAAA